MAERNYLKTEAVFLAEKTPKKEVVVTPPLREDSLKVTENGTYQAPIGRGYTDVEVNVPLTNIEPLYVTSNGTYAAGEGQAYNPVTVNLRSFAKAYTIAGTIENPLPYLSGSDFDDIIDSIGDIYSIRSKCMLRFATGEINITLLVSKDLNLLVASYGAHDVTISNSITYGAISVGTIVYKIETNRTLTLVAKKFTQSGPDGSNFIDISNLVPDSTETIIRLYKWEQNINQ